MTTGPGVGYSAPRAYEDYAEHDHLNSEHHYKKSHIVNMEQVHFCAFELRRILCSNKISYLEHKKSLALSKSTQLTLK